MCFLATCVLYNLQLSKMNVVNRWHKNQLLALHEARVAALEGEVDRVKRELTESQVTAKEEKRLLRQQVDTLQKVSVCVCVCMHACVCVFVCVIVEICGRRVHQVST